MSGGFRGYRPVPIKGNVRMARYLYIFQRPHVSPDNFGGHHVLPAIRHNADKIAELFLKSVEKLLKGLL